MYFRTAEERERFLDKLIDEGLAKGEIYPVVAAQDDDDQLPAALREAAEGMTCPRAQAAYLKAASLFGGDSMTPEGEEG